MEPTIPREDESLKQMLHEELGENVDLVRKKFPVKSKSSFEEDEKSPKICDDLNDEIVEAMKIQNSLEKLEKVGCDPTFPNTQQRRTPVWYIEIARWVGKPVSHLRGDYIKEFLYGTASIQYREDNTKVWGYFAETAWGCSSCSEKSVPIDLQSLVRYSQTRTSSAPYRRRSASHSFARSRKNHHRRSRNLHLSFRKRHSGFFSDSRSRSLSSHSSESSHSYRISNAKSINSIKHKQRKVYCNNRSYEYCRAIKDIKYIRNSKSSRKIRSSYCPSSEKFSSHSSYSTRRFPHLFARESLLKETDYVLHVDTTKSFISYRNVYNIDGEQNDTDTPVIEVAETLKLISNMEESSPPSCENKNNLYQQELHKVKKNFAHKRRLYRRRAEKYPAFQDEWKAFWCRRFQEIRDDGQNDPYSYDYKPDWIQYWSARIKKLMKEKYKEKKMELKEKFGIKNKEKNKPIKSLEDMKIADEFETVSSWEESDSNKSNEMICSHRENIKTNSMKSNDELLTGENSTTSTFSVAGLLSRNNVLRQTSLTCQAAIEKTDELLDVDLNDDINLITVLRLLSVMESQLGSFAYMITNLLTSGLAAEKVKPTSSVALLTEKNCLFLNMVKEKLKGQLILEVVPKMMIQATRRCIKSIDELMKLIPETKSIDSQIDKIFVRESVSDNSPLHFPSGASQIRSESNVTKISSHESSSSNVYPVPLLYPSTQIHDNSNLYSSSSTGFHGTLPSNTSHNHTTRYPISIPIHASCSPHFPRPEVSSSVSTVPHITLPSTLYSGNSLDCESKIHFLTSSVIPISHHSLTSDTSSICPTSLEGRLISCSEKDSATTVSPPSGNQRAYSKRMSIYDEIPWKEQMSTSISPSAFAVKSASCSSDVLKSHSVQISPLECSQISPVTMSSLSTSTVTTIVDLTDEDKPVDKLPEQQVIQMLTSFRSLPRHKQKQLVNFMRKLEDTDPQTVENWKIYVNFSSTK